MKVQEQDVYHGIALTQLVEHGSFKAINKTSKNYGLYDLNHDRRLFVKYCSYDDDPWQFTFSAAEMALIDAQTERSTFVVLVCGRTTVCALSLLEIQSVVDLGGGGTQWIKVEAPAGASMRVTGSTGTLGRVVPHNSYPKKLFS